MLFVKIHIYDNCYILFLMQFMRTVEQTFTKYFLWVLKSNYVICINVYNNYM